MYPGTPRERLHVVDIGGSHITAAVVQLDGGVATVVAAAGRDTDPHAPAADILDTWAAACRNAVAGAGTAPGAAVAPTAWAIAMPDPFDFERGTGTFQNVAKFENLAGVDIRGELARRLGTAPRRVRFLHDAAAYGIGEWMFGAASGHDRAVCITLGTGVGSTFLDGGSPVSEGPGVPTNGTVHLLEVEGRPLEDSVSTRAIVADFAARTGVITTVKDIADRARADGGNAQAVLDHAMTALAGALAPWLARFGASMLVVGGSISRSWDLLEPAFRGGLSRTEPALAASLELEPSQLLDEAPLLGAAAWLAASEA